MFKGEIIGHIGADAVMNGTDGAQFISFRVAHTEKWKDGNGQDQSQTQWVDVTLPKEREKLIPYLRQGQMVFVRGFLSTRVYSSKKDRCMKAGVKIAATEIEFCGGQSDDVPRRLIIPENAMIVDTQKYYWVNVNTKGMKKDDVRPLVDERGRQYVMNNQGFVFPVPEENGEEEDNQDESTLKTNE